MNGSGEVPDQLRRAALRALGLPDDAAKKAIRQAYRRLARECHPDLHPGDPVREECFRLAAEAYEILTRPRPGGRYRLGRVPAETVETQPSGDGDYARWWREQFGDLF